MGNWTNTGILMNVDGNPDDAGVAYFRTTKQNPEKQALSKLLEIYLSNISMDNMKIDVKEVKDGTAKVLLTLEGLKFSYPPDD